MPAPPPLLDGLPNSNSENAPDSHFIVHLRTTIRQTLLSDKNTRISASDSGPWILVLKQLHDAFLVSFSFNDINWNAQPERVKLVEACLETIELILNHVDGALMEVPGSKDLSKKLFCALFTLCHTLDLYADTEIVPRDGVSMPATLREIACRTATLTLRRMGGGHPPSGDEPMWKILRDILQELLSLSNGESCAISFLCLTLCSRDNESHPSFDIPFRCFAILQTSFAAPQSRRAFTFSRPSNDDILI